MVQRRSTAVRAAVIGVSIGCLALAGCGSTPAPASPQSTSSATSAAAQGGPADEPAPTAQPTSAPPQADQPPAPTEDPAPLGPDGIGQLLLGMTFQEAKDAGFVRGKELPDCAGYDMYLGGEKWGLVYISTDRGVEAIAPERPVRTQEDVTTGTTTDRVTAAYPDFDANQLRVLDHVGVRAPGHPDATYRLQFDDSKKTVAGISLQRTDQHCYE